MRSFPPKRYSKVTDLTLILAMKLGASLALLSLLAVGGALIVTNPNEDDYAGYLFARVRE